LLETQLSSAFGLGTAKLLNEVVALSVGRVKGIPSGLGLVWAIGLE